MKDRIESIVDVQMDLLISSVEEELDQNLVETEEIKKCKEQIVEILNKQVEDQ